MRSETQAPTPSSRAARRWILVLLSLASLLYLGCHAFLPLSRLVFHETSVTPSAGVFFYAYTAVLLVEWVLYAACLRLLAAGSPGRKTLLVWSLALAFGAATVWPVVSSDHFQYLSHGRIFALFHENPFTVSYQSFGGDPLYSDLSTCWAVFPSSYGPVAVYVSSLPALAGGNSLVLGLGVSKLLYFLLFAATLVLVHRKTPDDRVFFLYAFNPLVISELLINAHNDLLLIFFMALGWCYLDGGRSLKRACLVLVLVGLTLFVKITPVILLPFVWLYLVAGLESWKQRIHFAWIGAVLFAALFVLLYLPFWEGVRTIFFPVAYFQVMPASGKIFPGIVARVVSLAAGDPSQAFYALVQKGATGLLVTGWAALLFLYLREVFRNRRERVWVYVALAYSLFLLLSPGFLPWYVCLGVFFLAVACGDNRSAGGNRFKGCAYAVLAFTLMGILEYLTLR